MIPTATKADDKVWPAIVHQDFFSVFLKWHRALRVYIPAHKQEKWTNIPKVAFRLGNVKGAENLHFID
jgi:hypothetical protein